MRPQCHQRNRRLPRPVKAAKLARVSLENRFPKGYLTVASDDDIASPASRENGGTVKHAGYFVEKRGLYTKGVPTVAGKLPNSARIDLSVDMAVQMRHRFVECVPTSHP